MSKLKATIKLLCPPIFLICLKKIFKKRNKIVCYTCITGGYDSLLPIFKKDNCVDYICFTDNINIAAKGWQIKKLPRSLKNFSSKLQNRIIKIKPHVFLKKYKYSIYVDGNILVNCSIASFIKKYNMEKYFLYVNKHPCRDCLYEEGAAVVNYNFVKKEDVEKQLTKYKNDGFPSHYGLTENNILLRKHNDFKCKKLMELWWNEVEHETYRDQLSLMYCVWKLNYSFGLLNVATRIGSMSEPFVLSIFHNSKEFTLCNSMDTNNVIIIKKINFNYPPLN